MKGLVISQGRHRSLIVLLLFPVRPWSDEFWQKNESHPDLISHHGVYAQPIREEDWMWFRGDRVQILRGKDKGKQGYINYIVQEKNWICVQGLNCSYQTVRELRKSDNEVVKGGRCSDRSARLASSPECCI